MLKRSTVMYADGNLSRISCIGIHFIRSLFGSRQAKQRTAMQFSNEKEYAKSMSANNFAC